MIVAGGRDFADYDMLSQECGRLICEGDEIVSGGAIGADSLAIRYAKELRRKYTVFRADWRTHGKAAGPIRNRQMAEYADTLIAFWDGKSRGTKNMIDEAKRAGMALISVFRY